MYIIISCSMDDQQIPFKILRMSNWRSFNINRIILLWQTCISFLVNIVVIMQVRYSRNSHSSRINFRITEHQVQRHGTSPAPTPDCNTICINKIPFDDLFGRHGLIIRIYYSYLLVNRMPPFCTFQTGSSPIIH